MKNIVMAINLYQGKDEAHLPGGSLCLFIDTDWSVLVSIRLREQA